MDRHGVPGCCPGNGAVHLRGLWERELGRPHHFHPLPAVAGLPPLQRTDLQPVVDGETQLRQRPVGVGYLECLGPGHGGLLRSGAPGPVQRWFRHVGPVLGVVTLGAAVLLAGGVRQSTAFVLAAELDENWRGAYDLLVTASADSLNRCASEEGQRVAANFSSAGEEGLSADDVAAIRGVPDVEVAAPIGLVGEYTGNTAFVFVLLPDSGSGPESGWQGYRVRTELVVDEGAQQLLMGAGESRFAVGETGLGSGNVTGFPGQYAFEVASIPARTQVIIAVDPVAERELLGEAGDFLYPLVVAGTGSRDFAGVGWDTDEAGILRSMTVPPEAYEDVPGQPTVQVLPMVVNTDAQFEVVAQFTAERLDLSNLPGDVDQRELDEAVRAATVSEELPDHRVRYSSELLPFADLGLTVPAWWDDAELTDDHGLSGSNYATAGRAIPGPLVLDADGCELTAVALGPVVPDNAGAGGPAARNFFEQTYRDVAEVEVDTPRPIPAVIGEYSSSTVDVGIDDVSYVPLGAYEPGETVIADPARGGVEPGTVLRAPLTGRGISVASAAGITDMQGARDLIGRDAVDAVRVRIAGLSGYDAAGRTKVAQVAADIQRLGYHVDVVAGSSREVTRIQVPDYYVDESGTAVGDLGVVEQQWSTLGAAGRVEASMDRVGQLLLAIAAGAAALASISVAAFAGRARRVETAVHAAMGWTSRDSARWLGGEQAVGLVVLAAFLAPALVVYRRTPEVMWTSTVVAAAFAAGAGIFMWQALAGRGAARRAGRDATRRRKASRHRPAASLGLTGFALRRLLHEAPTSLVLVLGLAGAGLAVSGSTLALLHARQASGETMLSALVQSSLLNLHLALAGTGLLASVLLAVVAGRVQLHAARTVESALIASGWTLTDLGKTRAVHTAVIGLLALGLAAGGARALATVMPEVSLPVVLAGAGATALATVVLGLSTVRKVNR